jgi:hypothetical protein
VGTATFGPLPSRRSCLATFGTLAEAAALSRDGVSQLWGLMLCDHQHVTIRVREPHLLWLLRCAVDDLADVDPVGEQLLAQRSQVVRNR